MSDFAIRVENLGKRYQIGRQQAGYKTIRETITDGIVGPFRRVRKLLKGQATGAAGLDESIWALKDVSFEVKHGEVIGIIGSNGAGKSTLLKIISRITEPTEGVIDIYGRVGSLLEVGTGFHPELTGRENIYLNGAILGMHREEIDKKFDEIVAFAEIEKFIDTPVKYYSSGMGLRLGFAVAAYLEPDILVVDEVLAVGDAAFQKKCLGKMGDVAQQGRTVLFVSHNMSAIKRLCSSCVWLNNGRVRIYDTVNIVVHDYSNSTLSQVPHITLPNDLGKPMRLRKIQVLGQTILHDNLIEFSEPINIVLEYNINQPVSSTHVACFIYTLDGVCILGSGDADIKTERLGTRAPGKYKASFQIPSHLLGEGMYTVTVTMGKPYVQVYDRHESIVQFEVIDETSTRRRFQHQRRPGILGIELPWLIEEFK